MISFSKNKTTNSFKTYKGQYVFILAFFLCFLGSVTAQAQNTNTEPWTSRAFDFQRQGENYRLYGLITRERFTLSVQSAIQSHLINTDISYELIYEDRYKSRHVIIKSGDKSLQAELLEKGLALLSQEAYASYPSFRKAEAQARGANLGLWKNNGAFLKDKNTRTDNGFILFEDVIHSIKATRNVAYINFDDNWREDFTILIPIEDWPAYEALLKPGQRIYTRGFLQSYYGPMLKIHHEHAITVAKDAISVE